MSAKPYLEKLYNTFLASKGICTDSRKLQEGEIFLALKGPNFDGNAYGLKAIEQGAVLSVIDDAALIEQAAEPDKLLLVNDGLEALQALARHHRRQLKAPVIAITGSNGKTTTKELLTAVMSTHYKTTATKGNLNNHIGVPLTLLSINKDCEFAIIEMGANHQREIAALCEIAEPDFGLITNIGSAHLEGFGGLEGVKKGKGELYDFLKANEGLIFRYSGQEELAELAGDYARQVTYGFNAVDFVQGEVVEGAYYAAASMSVGGNYLRIATQLVGDYNLPNILAAVCVGAHQGVDPESICNAIEQYTPANNRSQLKELGEWQLIMDAYNANPTSTRAALQHFGAMETGDRGKVAVLGDMLELGEEASSAHQQIVEEALKQQLDKIVLVGPEYGKLVFNEENVLHFTDAGRAGAWLQQLRNQRYTILLKGSRGIGLEKVLEGID